MPTIARRRVGRIKLPRICAGSADYKCESLELNLRQPVGSTPHIWIQEIRMNTKLLTSTLLAVSLLGVPAVAFAQAETAAPPAAEKNMKATPSAQQNMNSAKGGHFRAGTTTGLGSEGAGRARPGGQSVARKPAD
jgi:hypothetical protein